MLRSLRVATLVVVASSTLMAACGDSPLREDEFLCEEAYAQLEKCCPYLGYFSGNEDPYYCTFDADAGGAPLAPALAPEESECIVGESCTTLQTSGVCARAARAKPQPDVARSHGVCP